MTPMQELKAPIRAFMREHYTDERLAQLLCHARDGKLVYHSCCCFIGIPTATHALRARGIKEEGGRVHSVVSRYTLSGAESAEDSFRRLAVGDDAARRRKLIPMIRAEMKRRERLRPSEPPLPPKETTQAGEFSHTPCFRR